MCRHIALNSPLISSFSLKNPGLKIFITYKKTSGILTKHHEIRNWSHPITLSVAEINRGQSPVINNHDGDFSCFLLLHGTAGCLFRARSPPLISCTHLSCLTTLLLWKWKLEARSHNCSSGQVIHYLSLLPALPVMKYINIARFGVMRHGLAWSCSLHWQNRWYRFEDAHCRASALT